MKSSLDLFGYKILYLLILLMPLHYYFSEILLKHSSVDNLWRDGLILGACVLLSTKKTKSKFMGRIILFNLFIIVIYASFSISEVNTFNIARTYIVPSLMYFIASKIEFDSIQLQKILKMIIYVGVGIALYGFVQAFFLGDDLLIKLGYPSYGGFLAGSSYYIGGFWGHQRVVGTFISPNICGVYLSIVLLVLLFSSVIKKGMKYYIYLSIVSVGLIGTFSRSAILAFFVAAFLWFFILNRKLDIKILFKVFIFSMISVLLITFIDLVFLNNLFTNMIFSSISGATSVSDTSIIKHIEDLYHPLAVIAGHPFGLGFGNSGPMALAYLDDATTVESSIYLIMYDIGIVGGVLYLLPYILLLKRTIMNHNANKFYLPGLISCCIFTTYIVLPNIQTYEVLFYFYLFLGLYDNESINNLFNSKEYIRHRKYDSL